MTDFIPLCEPEIRGHEWKYVKECLDTGWVSSVGAYVDRFEQEVAATVQCQHAVATSSGTAALHIALLVAGVLPDEEVLISNLTFIAPANAVRYVGAWPVFVDSESDYWQLDPSKLADFLELQCRFEAGRVVNKISGRRIAALLPVHILGHPVDMKAIVDIGQRYELPVIEDASEALGASCGQEPVGHLGDIACFSFNGNKIITTGGGGMIVTDNSDWATRSKYLTTQAKDDPIEFIHSDVGYNYRLSNVQAAIGCAQLEKLQEYTGCKRAIAERYTRELLDLPGLSFNSQADWAESTFWLYTVLIDEGKFGLSSRRLLKILAVQNIQSRPLWQPLHLSEPYKGMLSTSCEISEKLYAQALCLPCSIGLSKESQDRVIEAIWTAYYEGKAK